MADGWDEDDNDIDLSNANGWGDDDFFFQEDDDEKDNDLNNDNMMPILPSSSYESESHFNSNIQQKTETIEVEGWDDDVNLDSFDDFDDEKVETVATATTAHTRNAHLQHEIQMYLDHLELLQPSLNAVLQSEYSTPEKAQELIEYYKLDRMEYTVVTEDGDIVTDKTEIAELLQNDPTLVAHCANQSLLADLLQVCTGPDLLVQFLAAAMAQRVQFRLDLTAAVIQAHATLSLSLPNGHGRWSVATVQVQVVFSCHPQHAFVEYHIHSIQKTIDPESYQSSLNSCVHFLASMDPQDDMRMRSPTRQQQQSTTDFRDLFLQQSQAVFSNSATGLKSALADMDSVTGLSQKLQNIPRFLPGDVLEAAASEQQQQHQQPVHRPTSILGGLDADGLTKLAQSVALPEEDPSMYTDLVSGNSPLERHSQHRTPSAIPPPINPLDRLMQGQQSSNNASANNAKVNPLDRLARAQQNSSHTSSGVGGNPLDRLAQVQPIPKHSSSSGRVNPLDRLTQGQQHSSQASSSIPTNPLDRLSQSYSNQQHSSHAPPSSVPTNPLDRLTEIRPKPSTESPLSLSALPRNNIAKSNSYDEEDENEELLEDGWDDVDDIDLEDDEVEDVAEHTNQATILNHSPLEDKIPSDYKYNPDDDIIPRVGDGLIQDQVHEFRDLSDEENQIIIVWRVD